MYAYKHLISVISSPMYYTLGFHLQRYSTNKIKLAISNGCNDLRHQTMIVGGNALIYLQSISSDIGSNH